jgi:hypothetical protein
MLRKLHPVLTGALACASVASAMPAAGQSADFTEILSGRVAPLTLKMRDLTGDWRRVQVVQGARTDEMARLSAAIYGGVTAQDFYTQGRTVSVAGETWLVAYRVEPRHVELAVKALMERGELTVPELPTPDTPLWLALMPVRALAGLVDVRPFDLERETRLDAPRQTARQREQDQESVANLKRIGLGLAMYADEHDDRLPAMDNIEQVRKAVAQFVPPDAKAFAHPETHEPYRTNWRMSGAKWQENPDTPLVWEAGPGADGKRAVLFNDGRVERVSREQWERLQREFNLP